jgi:GntR family galactonate operon transcriptional repressor
VPTQFLEPTLRPEKLHARVTRQLAKRVMEAAQDRGLLAFPKESDLCLELGVSRTVVRESMKVLADKGMVSMKPRAGTHSRPRAEWRQLDPDILTWQAEVSPDAQFLRDLCEVRLAMEPTAAGFAAVRATPEDLRRIETCLRNREAGNTTATPHELIDLDLQFHMAVVAASHNPLLIELSGIIRQPFRTALACTSRFRSTAELSLQAHRGLFDALSRQQPMEARRAAEQVVGFAMLAVERAVRVKRRAGGAVD